MRLEISDAVLILNPTSVMSTDQTLSFVIPVYNEEDNISNLCDAIVNAMKNTDYKYDIILVNDGSSDSTWFEIKKASEKYPQLVGLNLFTNTGQSAAMSAGIEQAEGDFIVTLDGDLQYDPSDVEWGTGPQ